MSKANPHTVIHTNPLSRNPGSALVYLDFHCLVKKVNSTAIQKKKLENSNFTIFRNIHLFEIYLAYIEFRKLDLFLVSIITFFGVRKIIVSQNLCLIENHSPP